MFALGAGVAGAYPIQPTPAPTASASPTPLVSNALTLPFDSNLTFVLDDPISSKSSKKGQLVRAHLKDPISLAGHVLAPAGAPATIRIVAVSSADIGDVYGFVDIFFEPLALPDGRTLPLRAPVARLEPHVSAGHESTVAVEDTIEDQVIPYHWLYHILRKGKNFVLNPGSEIPARTEATVSARPNGTIAIETPAPPQERLLVPKSAFPVVPVATPFGPDAQQHRHTPAPLPSPSGTASPAGSPAAPATASPTPWPKAT